MNDEDLFSKIQQPVNHYSLSGETVCEVALRNNNLEFLDFFEGWENLPSDPKFYQSIQYSIGCEISSSVTSLRKNLYEQQLKRALRILPKIVKKFGTELIAENFSELLWDLCRNPNLKVKHLKQLEPITTNILVHQKFEMSWKLREPKKYYLGRLFSNVELADYVASRIQASQLTEPICAFNAHSRFESQSFEDIFNMINFQYQGKMQL